MEEKKKKSYLPTKFSLFIRIAVGLYLFYTAYSLKDALTEYSGGQFIFFIAAIIIFGAIAAFLCIHSVKSLIQGKYEGGAPNKQEDKFETKTASNIECMSAEADKVCKDEEKSV